MALERDFPGGLVVKTVLPKQEAKVPSLGGELGFHTLRGMPKYNIKKWPWREFSSVS